MSDSELVRSSIRVEEESLDYLDELADEHGSNRSRMIERMTEEHSRLRELAMEERMTPEQYLGELEAGALEDDRTFVEKIAEQEFRAALASILSLLWNVLVLGTVVLSGPSTFVTAFGAAGFLGIVAFLSLALVTSVAVLWLAVLAALAVVWVRDRRTADAAEEAI